jgi:thioredoxin 1
MGREPIDVTDGTFEAEVLDAEMPVLVDFGAEWCHPCKLLDPIVDELAQEWDGKVKVVKLDIDENGDTTTRFGVMGVPTLMLFKDGNEQERLVGFLPKKRILEKLGPHLGHD